MGTLPRNGSVEVIADASPDAIWAVIADVTRVSDWSHECRAGMWVDGATEARPGARFRGQNRVGRTKWSRVCEIVTADAPRELAWKTIATPIYNDSTRWRITLEPVDGGTRITQSFEVLKLGPVMDRLFYLLVPKHRDRMAALTDDIRRIGEVARTGVPAISEQAS